MTHIMPQYRIALAPRTEADLEALRYAFEGNLAHGEHQECGDDVLVAVLLGWHLRKLGRQRDHWIKSVAQEFSIRVRNSKGKEYVYDDEESRKLSNLRKGAKGCPSTAGNILTLDGIDSHTLVRICARVHAVTRMIDKLNEIYDARGDSYTEISETLARYSDQAIIDLGVWWTLTHMAGREEEVEEFPHWVKDQVAARAEMREEYEASLATEPRAGIDTEKQALPKLSVRDRWEFCRPRRISTRDPFWTDERIRAALGLGL